MFIGSLVGAVLLFGWQSLSWTVLHLHDKAYQYSPAQDTVLSVLNSAFKTEGQYMLPRLPEGASHEDMEKAGKEMEGKPWAVVTYHQAYTYDMVLPIARGFLIALICVILVCQVIKGLGKKSLGAIFVSVLTFGVVAFLFVWYNGHNWFKTPWDVLNPELLDAVVGWGLTGLWLGWWYSRK